MVVACIEGEHRERVVKRYTDYITRIETEEEASFLLQNNIHVWRNARDLQIPFYNTLEREESLRFATSFDTDYFNTVSDNNLVVYSEQQLDIYRRSGAHPLRENIAFLGAHLPFNVEDVD